MENKPVKMPSRMLDLSSPLDNETILDHPRGTPENRMSDGELRDKFVECAGSRMPIEQIDRVVETCFDLDELDDIGELMPQLVVQA